MDKWTPSIGDLVVILISKTSVTKIVGQVSKIHKSGMVRVEFSGNAAGSFPPEKCRLANEEERTRWVLKRIEGR